MYLSLYIVLIDDLNFIIWVVRLHSHNCLVWTLSRKRYFESTNNKCNDYSPYLTTIQYLVDVLQDVFHTFHWACDFNIHMSIADLAQQWVIRYDPAIVYVIFPVSPHYHAIIATILRAPSSVFWVAISIWHRVALKLFGKLFCTFSPFHAWWIWVPWPTWSMDHAGCDWKV